MCECQVAIVDLYGGVSLASKLTDSLDHLSHAAAVAGMVVAQPTAIGVERQFADARDEVPVGHKTATLAALTEAKVLELNDHGDREAIVDGGIFDIRRRDTRFGE